MVHFRRDSVFSAVSQIFWAMQEIITYPIARVFVYVGSWDGVRVTLVIFRQESIGLFIASTYMMKNFDRNIYYKTHCHFIYVDESEKKINIIN